jgi:hypothetical protein
MANALYSSGKQGFLEGALHWLTDTIKVQLVDAALYTPNLATHDNFDDIPVGARVGAATALAGKTSTGGVADASDTVIPAVTGAESEYLVIFKDSGVDGTSTLIALIDTATNLPVTPNGGDITIVWDPGANKIFKF